MAVSNSNPGPFGFVGWDRSLGPDTPGIAKHGRSREMEYCCGGGKETWKEGEDYHVSYCRGYLGFNSAGK